jgi:hypothetical protein
MAHSSPRRQLPDQDSVQFANESASAARQWRYFTTCSCSSQRRNWWAAACACSRVWARSSACKLVDTRPQFLFARKTNGVVEMTDDAPVAQVQLGRELELECHGCITGAQATGSGSSKQRQSEPGPGRRNHSIVLRLRSGASKRLFGRCFLIISCGPAQHDDLVIQIVVVQHSDTPSACSGSDLDRMSAGGRKPTLRVPDQED